ncbi:MAG TPA: amidohydrolase family protein [Candidatus Limnocylindrales bacterium]|nr:amidohydrolase family protein [Candidatus Limnocylindrales bacterium]
MIETLKNEAKTRIDVHAHAFPPEFMKLLRKNASRPLDIRSNWEWDESRFLGEMDQWGVGLQVLSLPHVYEYYDPANLLLGVELCQVANSDYAEISARRADRFRFFSAVPLPDVAAACKELDRARKIAGFSGITLSTNLHERTLDDPAFASFFEHANAAGVVIFLHPLQRPFPKEWYGYRLEHLIGLPVDTTFTLARLALCGFFDRYANIKIIAAHVGGTLPFLAPRIERAFREGKSQNRPSHYFRKLFYDTSGPTHEAILAAVAKMFGSEQIVFGTDYPFGLGQEGKQYVEHAIGVVEESGLSETDLRKIFSANARKLLAI